MYHSSATILELSQQSPSLTCRALSLRSNPALLLVMRRIHTTTPSSIPSSTTNYCSRRVPSGLKAVSTRHVRCWSSHCTRYLSRSSSRSSSAAANWALIRWTSLAWRSRTMSPRPAPSSTSWSDGSLLYSGASSRPLRVEVGGAALTDPSKRRRLLLLLLLMLRSGMLLLLSRAVLVDAGLGSVAVRMGVRLCCTSRRTNSLAPPYRFVRTSMRLIN